MTDWKVGVSLKLALAELPAGAMQEAVRVAIEEMGFNRKPAPDDLHCTHIGEGCSATICRTPLRYAQFVLEQRDVLGKEDDIVVIANDYEMVLETTEGDHLYCPKCLTEYQMPDAYDWADHAEVPIEELKK